MTENRELKWVTFLDLKICNKLGAPDFLKKLIRLLIYKEKTLWSGKKAYYLIALLLPPYYLMKR